MVMTKPDGDSNSKILGSIKSPAARRILKPFFYAYPYVIGSRLASRKLKRLADECDGDIEKLVTLAFDFEYKQLHKSWLVIIRPLQVKSELTSLCRKIKEWNPKVIVEIGTANGGTLFFCTRVADPEKIVSVDLPSGSFGGGYPYWKIPFFKALGKKNVVQLVRADSHREETLSKVKELLNGKKVDYLFIDGDHTYEGVKQDFIMYSPLVRKGGLVVFHDIVKVKEKIGCDVDKFWNEIKQQYPHAELIEDPNQNWSGIGILYP
jgi:predicted O-methyltransferase YrrM